jgi:purine-nucleoside phosphorylase
MYLYNSIEEAHEFLSPLMSSVPRVALILGTGLGGVADGIEVGSRVPFAEIPYFPQSTVEGHKGDLLFGRLGGLDVVVMQGRFHYYEGRSLQTVTMPVRLMRRLGAEYLIINSAAGGLNPEFTAGDVMIVRDHINFMGDNPLRGVADPRLGDRFPDMSDPYDKRLAALAEESASEAGFTVRSGVYAAVSGPSIETRAETRMLRLLGADAVGMSTVPEVIVGCQVGFKILVLAAITNVNIPAEMEPVSIEKVIQNAKLAEKGLQAITEGTLTRLAKANDQ